MIPDHTPTQPAPPQLAHAEQEGSAQIPCLAMRSRRTARALDISERKLWEITADQTSGIPHVRLGKAVVYPIRELADWLAQQAAMRAKP